jgi:peptidoglycan/xylan/chitin deacetylase (PgdA/CDA1 family)
MSWEDARELAAAGNELGSHSMTHPLLPQLDERALEYEIAESRRVIRERTGARVDSFCYPNGDHTARIVEITRRSGYENAVTALFGNNRRGADPFTLER